MTTNETMTTQYKAYFDEANSWRADIVAARERELTLYRKFCIGLFASLAAALVGLTSLITRESVQPFLAIMDKRTGEVTTPTRLNTQSLVVNWKMVRHFVTTYVNDRESYNFLNINEPYLAVRAMSNEPVKAQVDQILRPELNPQSPIKTLGQHHYITTTIHSIAKLTRDNLLDIRFTTHTVNSETNKVEQNKAWRVTMKWELLNRNRSLSDWDTNPLGFTVTFYDKQPVVS
ncbi:virB8 family protein [Legionella feeleii]|uniref:Type IV secretion system protein virB8 n=1 Tax=Legionella feeleii TaxID=453 RepID=A0A378IW57_9GAMM|nr:type IV secretion system protein [Legionella feeleii]STX39293.1 Type IV secretion system protein virB8 [Legionella feeleii]